MKKGISMWDAEEFYKVEERKEKVWQWREGSKKITRRVEGERKEGGIREEGR